MALIKNPIVTLKTCLSYKLAANFRPQSLLGIYSLYTYWYDEMTFGHLVIIISNYLWKIQVQT